LTSRAVYYCFVHLHSAVPGCFVCGTQTDEKFLQSSSHNTDTTTTPHYISKLNIWWWCGASCFGEGCPRCSPTALLRPVACYLFRVTCHSTSAEQAHQVGLFRVLEYLKLNKARAFFGEFKCSRGWWLWAQIYGCSPWSRPVMLGC